MNHPTADLVIQRPAQASQLILLFHGVGSSAASMATLGEAYAHAFPLAQVVTVQSPIASDIFPGGWQWFSVRGITEENRVERVAQALPAFESCVRTWQERSGVDAQGTALVGFSQGGIMALAASVQAEPVATRYIALGSRYAVLPEQALHGHATVHLLHGKADTVMPYSHTIEAAMRLKALGCDFTAEVLPFVGHELHPELMKLAVEKLQSHIPSRLWLQPGEADALNGKDAS